MNRWTLAFLLILIAIIVLAFLLPIPWYPLSNTKQISLNPNEEIRAALDIGSGATSIKVAKVNRENNKIIEKIFEKSIPVPYQKHLELSGNNTFDQPVIEQGIKAINELKKMAMDHQAQKVIGVATAAFRNATNAPQFVQEIQNQTGLTVHIINQDEEGILAFRGALATTSLEPKKVIVWDIGGGSMQLTTLTETGSYLVDKGKTASIPFKNAVIQEIKHANLQEVHSPNPLSLDEMGAALKIARESATAVDPYIKMKISEPGITVLSVGSLFNYGIKPLGGNQHIVTAEKLQEAVIPLAGQTDEQLGHGHLSEVAVTNPLLVLGYMKELKIPQMEIISINNADGVLTYPVFWNSIPQGRVED